MRCTGVKLNRDRAFSLIELIGVLMVVAILASLLVPRVFNAIHNASINQTASSLNTLKTACVGHYAKFTCLATDGSVNPPAAILLDGSDARSTQFDKVLLWESFLDSIFSPKIGDRVLGASNTRVQIVAALAASTAPTADNSAYSFGTAGNNEASGSVVVEAIITGVSLEDAKALNDVLDGPSLGENSSGDDLLGRVKYGSPATSSSSGNGNSGGNGNGNGNGNGLGNGNGNGGNNNGNGNGGNDNGNGNGNGSGNNSGSGTGTGTQTANTVTVHVYLTHR